MLVNNNKELKHKVVLSNDQYNLEHFTFTDVKKRNNVCKKDLNIHQLQCKIIQIYSLAFIKLFLTKKASSRINFIMPSVTNSLFKQF